MKEKKLATMPPFHFRGEKMFQKLAPLIILAIFAVGTYFIIQGLEHASNLAHPKKTTTQGDR